MTTTQYGRGAIATLIGCALAGLIVGLVTSCEPEPAAAALPDPASAKLMVDAIGYTYLWQVATQEHQAGVLTKDESTKLLALATDAQQQIKLADAAINANSSETYKISLAKVESDVYAIYAITNEAAKRPIPAKAVAPVST